MKPSFLGLLIAAGAFGASTIWLMVQLDEERTRAEQVLAESQALKQRVAELESLRADLAWVREADGDVFSAGDTGRVSTAEPARPMPLPSMGMSETVTAEIAPGRARPPAEPPEAVRRMMRTQMRARIKELYAGIGTKLGLSAEDTSRLIDLLTDQQVADMEAGRNRWRNGQRPDVAQRQAEEQKRLDAVANLIGYDKVELFKDYQQTLPARQEVSMIARQLDGADQGLSADQQERLIAALAEERNRVPQPEYVEGTSRDDYRNAMVAWQEDYAERSAARARGILNTSQLATYHEYQDLTRQMRQRFETRRGVIAVDGDVAVAGSADRVMPVPPPRR